MPQFVTRTKHCLCVAGVVVLIMTRVPPRRAVSAHADIKIELKDFMARKFHSVGHNILTKLTKSRISGGVVWGYCARPEVIVITLCISLKCI